MDYGNIIKSCQEMDDQPLFHYTSEKGLRGIIESNYLRATCFNSMNDDQEVQTGKQIFRNMEELLNNPNFIGDFAPIRQAMLDSLDSINSSDVFGCCFCSSNEKRDSSTHWDKYGANHMGFAIGLKVKELVMNNDKPIICKNVMYENHMEAAKYILKKIFLQMKVCIQKNPNDYRYKAWIKQIFDIILLRFIPLFKDPKWKQECEFRLIYDPEWTKKNHHFIKSVLRDKKKVRYIPLRPKHGVQLPIVEIVIGSQRGAESEQCLRAYLDRNGYRNVQIARSDCIPPNL